MRASNTMGREVESSKEDVLTAPGTAWSLLKVSSFAPLSVAHLPHWKGRIRGLVHQCVPIATAPQRGPGT